MKYTKWLFLVLILAMAECSSTKITSSWKAENKISQQYKKILVLGLVNGPDRSVREKMEEHIVGDLKELGYSAVCSCNEFDPKAFENMTEKQALDKLGASGIDVVLTIVLLDKTKERYYVPGRVQYSPYNIYQNEFWGYYRTMTVRVYTPGYYAEDTKYFWESNFYELGAKTLLYSAQSQSFDPGSTATLAHEYGKLIVNDMVRQQVLKRP